MAYAPARGFTKGRLLIEPQAKTTIENALVSRQMLAPERGKVADRNVGRTYAARS